MMAIVTGDRYLESLVKFVERQAGPLIEGTLVLKLNPVGLHYVQSRLEALYELESLLAGAPVDYLRAYISDLGDHRALEQLRRILRLIPSLKVVSMLPPPARDPTPLSLLPFGRLKVLELRGCDLSTSAARGLLELRHTLEKIICHNSTDALRHVFAGRIAEIKESPQWNQLSFVSCACNGLVLMDESLQLLPAVETLDLSRNKFAKVDNIRKCTKLKHLDLGFNHMRTIASISDVPSHIVKLVLRNNALTTLRGIENLKSIEGLDLSFNIISNFSELEILGSLPSLRSLWLEGNPLCCARWYRAHVFSFFAHPGQLKLDEKEISTKEFWKRQIIIASRQARPASFGFYSPVTKNDQREGSIYTKRKKLSRVASIECEEERIYNPSDQESESCENEIHSREESSISGDEAEIIGLMNRAEFMKKERSVLWLREFKEWMDQSSENPFNKKYEDDHIQNKATHNHPGESSRYISDSFQASEDESSTNIMESETSFIDSTPKVLHSYTWFGSNATSVVGKPLLINQTGIGDLMESRSSPVYTGSPPHFQEDILHRRQNLEEEIMQLSAGSFSVASSDSNTSCSEANSPESDPSSNEEFPDKSLEKKSADFEELENQKVRKNGHHSVDSSGRDGEIARFVKQEADWLEKRKSKRNPKRRVVSLTEEDNLFYKREALRTLNGNLDTFEADEDMRGTQIFYKINANTDQHTNDAYCKRKSPNNGDDFIEKYFNSNIADSGLKETCRKYIRCHCVLEQESNYREREVAVVLSTEQKFYMLLIDVPIDGSGNVLRLTGCHRVEDVNEVLVGVGLHVVRVDFEGNAAYLFMTKSIEKSYQLLDILRLFDSCTTGLKCSIRSLELVQVELFEKYVCGGSKMNILQYSMVLFWLNDAYEGSWAERSVFVTGGHLLVCIEDFRQFTSLSLDASASPYFTLDSCCSVADISEMVVEARESNSITLTLTRVKSQFSWVEAGKEVSLVEKGKDFTGSQTWKLKWFSEGGLFQFVTLLKAIHTATTASPLSVRCIS